MQLIPRSVLFGNPDKYSPQLSPDGTKLAYLAPVENVLNVWVGSADGTHFEPVTQDRDRGVRTFFWAYDNRHLLYLQDLGGNENWRIYSVDLQSGKTRDLTPFENVQARVLSVEKDFPDEILISLNKENPSAHDVYRLNLSTGNMTLVEKNPGDYSGWITDSRQRVLGAVRPRPEGGSDILMRAQPKDPFKKFLTWDLADDAVSRVIALSKDATHVLLADARGYNTARLVRAELKTGKTEILSQDQSADVAGVTLHPDSLEIQIIWYYRARPEMLVVDPSIQPDVDYLKTVQKGDFYIGTRDQSDKRWIVAYVVDDGPMSFYLYDRTARSARFLFDSTPALRQYTCSAMEPVVITARDGLQIHGYISFPPGQERKNLPMVLNVHGGPWARDNWGFDTEAQWLTNRGYICLQVNFRGSVGYGKEFVNAGNRQWGRKMQDDLTDAVRWAIDKGYADPKRVAIYGGSYGGYAALAGATFTPDLYACAVDIVGPSSLTTFIKTVPPYWKVYLNEFYIRVGHPEKDRAYLEERSPLYHVDKINTPLLIAQGANDPRVKQSESEQIVAELKKKGIAHEYMLFKDEGHGFAKPQNRIKFYAACEKFLAKHLGGRYET